MTGRLNCPIFPADAKGMATRASSGKIINALAPILPELIGGSADLAPSNNTKIDGSPAFQKESRDGRNFHFGVREHAMGAVLNGMTLFGGSHPLWWHVPDLLRLHETCDPHCRDFTHPIHLYLYA